MSLQKQVWIWAIIIGASVLFLWVMRPILLPFVVGMGLAYLLDPVADLLEKWKFPRALATALVVAVMILLVIGAFLVIVPVLVQQTLGLIEILPGYITDLQALANQWLPEFYALIGEERAAEFENSLSGLVGNGLAFVGNLTAQVMQSGLTFINAIGLLIVTPVVTFYMLLDWDRMTKAVDELLPRAYRDDIRHVLSEINRSMAGVIRGQGSVMLILAVFYGVALSLIGLRFGLAIGIAAGLLGFIPFVGFIVGFGLSTVVALVQFWPEWPMIALVVGVFLVGQFLEGNVLYPNLVGSSIKVHPVWLMFALFAVGILFGFVGLLLAVPFVAIAGVLMRFAIQKYRNSPLYGAPPEVENSEESDVTAAKAE